MQNLQERAAAGSLSVHAPILNNVSISIVVLPELEKVLSGHDTHCVSDDCVAPAQTRTWSTRSQQEGRRMGICLCYVAVRGVILFLEGMLVIYSIYPPCHLTHARFTDI
jgi:hypothetical protein